MSASYLAGPEIRPFSTYENSMIRDPNLSFRALGVLARLLSNAPGYKQDSRALARERPGKEGRDAIRSALRELEETGYCRRVLARKPDGTIYGQFVFYYGSLEAAATHQIGKEIMVDEEGKPIEDRGPENPAAGFPGTRKTRRPDFQARKKEQIRSNKPPPPPPSVSAKGPRPEGGGGDLIDKKSLSDEEGGLDDLLAAAVWGEGRAGRKVGPGFRPWKRQRLLESGPSPDDLALLAAWRGSFREERRPEIRDERAEAVRHAAIALTSALRRGLPPELVEQERAALRRLAPSHPLLQTKAAVPEDRRTTS